jgi:sec-independent protein translocase protein TatB
VLNLDPAKVLVILVVALIVLGPERLPKVARQMAGIWREFTKIRDQVTEEVRSALPDIDIPRIPHIPSPSSAISGLLNGMTTIARSTSARGAGTEDPSVDQTAGEGAVEAAEPPIGRVPPRVVVHPTLGDVAFLPDDPSMN